MLTEYQMIPSIHVYTTSCLNHNKHTYVLKYVYHFIVVKKNHLIILGFGRHTLNYQPPMQSHAVLHSTPFTVYYRNMQGRAGVFGKGSLPQGRGRSVQQGKPSHGICNWALEIWRFHAGLTRHPHLSQHHQLCFLERGREGLLTLLRSLFQVTWLEKANGHRKGNGKTAATTSIRPLFLTGVRQVQPNRDFSPKLELK